MQLLQGVGSSLDSAYANLFCVAALEAQRRGASTLEILSSIDRDALEVQVELLHTSGSCFGVPRSAYCDAYASARTTLRSRTFAALPTGKQIVYVQVPYQLSEA